MANIAPIPPVPMPPPSGKPGGIAEKIEGVLNRIIAGAVNVTVTPLAHALRYGIQSTLEELEVEFLEIIKPTLLDIRNSEDMPDSIKARIDALLTPRHPAWLLALVPLIPIIVGPIINMLAPIIAARWALALNRIFHPFRLPFDIVSAAIHRGVDFPKITKGDLYDAGWTDQRIEIAEIATKRRPDVGQMVDLYRRGEMTWEAVRAELLAQEWTEVAADGLKKIIPVIPGVQDLVYFADRLAWNEEYSRLAGLDADMDPRLTEWASKQGLSPEWTKLYWRAHWQPIDLGLGFEMLHRGVITMDEMLTFLKAQKIPPALQKAYVQIAYNLPTRVDVRRAYKEGVVTLADVQGVYLALGYEAKWAKILTDWTAKAYAPEEKEVTVGDIRSALQKGMLTEAEATDYLKSLDVGDDAIAFYIAQARFARAADLKQIRIHAIEQKFVSGRLDRAGAASALTALSLPASEIEVNLDAWQTAREAKVKQPSESQLRGFYLDDIITTGVFQRELKELGYDDDTITLYVRQADADKERQTKVAAEAAQAKQDRLAKAEKATAYQKAVADIDVQISDQRQIITNAQAALNAGLSDKARRDAEDKVFQLADQIAAERKTIATFSAQREAAKSILDSKISAVLRDQLDKAIGDAQASIAETNQKVKALDTEIAHAKLALLTATESVDQAQLKTSIAEMNVEIATLHEDVAAFQLDITNARNTLRAYITDSERQTLESTIRDANDAIAKSQANIADYNAQQAVLRTGIAAALNTDQRAALQSSIDDARKAIAELQVKRAEARSGA